MLRLLLRITGFILLAGAFATVIVDGTRSVAAGHLMMFSLGETAAWLFPGPMAELGSHAAQATPAWRAILDQGFMVPTWVVGVVAAVVALVAGRRPQERIGYGRRR